MAAVGSDGIVRAVANGAATITARHAQFSDTVAVIVESGVSIDSLTLTPAVSTLRASGASLALALVGHFSNGETRDLTADPGAKYRSSDSRVAAVDAVGRVRALTNGEAAVTAGFDTAQASVTVRVAISAGAGFLQGAVLDDRDANHRPWLHRRA